MWTGTSQGGLNRLDRVSWAPGGGSVTVYGMTPRTPPASVMARCRHLRGHRRYAVGRDLGRPGPLQPPDRNIRNRGSNAGTAGRIRRRGSAGQPVGWHLGRGHAPRAQRGRRFSLRECPSGQRPIRHGTASKGSIWTARERFGSPPKMTASSAWTRQRKEVKSPWIKYRRPWSIFLRIQRPQEAQAFAR